MLSPDFEAAEVIAACHARKIIPCALIRASPELNLLSEIICKIVVPHLEFLTISKSFVMVR